jgi:maltooligosyltrehalose trehalohydrolase
VKIGNRYSGSGQCEFSVWAPFLRKVAVSIVSPGEMTLPMKQTERGYWKATAGNAYPGTRYFYQLDDERERPDPASHFQPEGVHGPSEVVDHSSFEWEDRDWKGIPLAEMIMYEVHIGTFTPEGTFAAVINRIDDLKDLGINTVELMPVAQFPGERNWGYDGVYPFAVQGSYGGPDGLKRLVNECHKKGIAVILDVVYNHIGPEGNYLWDYAPYFTDKYRTPWGQAVNFDDTHSNEVRNYFIENALHWFKNYHIDALRLDAIHGISDLSARPFLQELSERIEEFSSHEGKKVFLIAESDLNDSKVTRPRELGGYGIDAQWCDDFHHSVHAFLTGESQGYYIDFGRTEHLVKSIREGFVYSGQYSQYRKRNHGNSSKDRPADQFIVFSQNHDQIGNRMFGERLSTLVSFESLKLAAGVVLFSPYIPLLFMGEEYGEDAPFLYFVSHSDAGLIESVRKGREKEFRAFNWEVDPPDSQSIETFLKSKIGWEKRHAGDHKVLLDFYKCLMKLRKSIPALSSIDKQCLDVCGLEDRKVLLIRRWRALSNVFCIFNFSVADTRLTIPLTEGVWRKALDSAEDLWNGPGTVLRERITLNEEVTVRSRSVVLYVKEKT